MTELKKALEDLLTILDKERKALIDNELDNLLELIKCKEKQAEKINAIEETIEEISEEDKIVIRNLVEQVIQLQETNSLLTEQAMSYHLNLIEGIEQEAKKASNTYSKDGAYEQVSDGAIINKSI